MPQTSQLTAARYRQLRSTRSRVSQEESDDDQVLSQLTVSSFRNRPRRNYRKSCVFSHLLFDNRLCAVQVKIPTRVIDQMATLVNHHHGDMPQPLQQDIKYLPQANRLSPKQPACIDLMFRKIITTANQDRHRNVYPVEPTSHYPAINETLMSLTCQRLPSKVIH